MIYHVFLLAVLLGIPASVNATTRYADNQLVANCTGGTYSYAARNCTGSDGDAYTTPSAIISPTVAGDTICVRSGTTWNVQWDFQTPNKTGTVGNYITMGGCNGETPTLQYADTLNPGYGPIRARGNRGYFIFENMILDGSASTDASRSGFAIRDGNHHFIVRNLEIKNFKSVSAIYVGADDVTIQNCILHGQYSPTGDIGTRHYAIYFHHGNNGVIENNEAYNNDGGGLNIYPGPINNLVIRRNRVHDNNRWADIHVGGAEIFSSPSAGGGDISNVDVYDNEFYNNGSYVSAGTSWGLEVNTPTVSNVRVFNNVIYGNKTGGIAVNGPTVGIDVRNNLISGNGGTELVVTGGAVATVSHSACTAAESCGATNKVTLTTGIGDCVVNAAATDFRLKQGTNPCRDAGTAVSTRSDPVGLNDVGAYEQGVLSSAVVAAGFIDVTANIMTPGILPATAISGFTVACVGCTGTPAVSDAIRVSSTVIRLTIIGLSSNGTCTISLGSSNLKDSGYVGPTAEGYSQYINSVSGLSVSGTCQNTAGGGTSLPGTPYIIYEFDDNLSDSSGNNLHIVTSNGTSFTTGKYHRGLKTDFGEDDYAEIPYFSGVNPATQSLTIAGGVYIQPADVCALRAVGGTDPGVNQYFHVFYSGCTWRMLVQDSTNTATEFSVQPGWNHVCINFNAATDTATLHINRVAGASTGASVQTYTAFNFAGNFRIGRFVGSGLSTGPNHIYDRWVVYTSVADCTQIYDNWEPPSGTWTGTLSMVAGRFYMAKTDPASAVIPLASANNTNITLPPGAAAGVALQTDCTAANCTAIGQRLYYSCAACPSGGTDLAVPESASTDGVRLWGGILESGLLSGAHGANLSGALTHVAGGTHRTASSVLIIDLPQNGSTVERWIVVIEPSVAEGKTYCFKAKEQTGAALNAYTPSGGICVTTGTTTANSGP